MSPSSSIRCIQNDFRAYGTFGANCLSYVKIYTIYKQTETSIHLRLITKVYHRVCPK
jgi:hypothetical protein